MNDTCDTFKASPVRDPWLDNSGASWTWKLRTLAGRAGARPTRNLYTRLRRCNTALMNILEWWPLVDAGTRGWLIEHNGEPLPAHVIGDIMAVTGGTTDSEWWAGESADGPQLSDEAVDWIEAVANDEGPTPG